MVINLLGNAIKFTEEGEINLSVLRRGSVMRVSVEDTGIGMDEPTQEKLFQSFTQADASTTRKYGGTGLGLAISNKLVGLMGGRIRVNSTPGEGSEFWFEIEMTPAKESQDGALTLTRRLPDARVLVIDDNSTNCEILANQFNNWGLDVSVCKDSTRAIERMMVAVRISRPFDLIILDYCMPEMDGRDVAMAMRREPELKNTPIILLSSNYEILSKDEMESIGIVAAITKPARQSRLLDTVMEALYLNSAGAPSNETSTESEFRPDTNAQSKTPSTPIARGLTEHTPAASTSPIAKGQSGFSADVLIVEDNQVNRIVAEKMLAELDLTTDFAVNGRDGVDKVKQGNYGMILMDGHMPVMDGLAATREIRQWENSQNSQRRIPIIALTANVVQGIRRDCADAGMDHYLCKPITMASIKTVVDKFLRRIGSKRPALDANSNKNVVATPALPTSNESWSDVNAVAGSDFNQLKNSFEQPSAEHHAVSPSVSAATSRSLDQGNVSAELNENLLSMDKLREQFLGDEAFAKQILQVMHETLPAQVEKLQAASTRQDFQQVASLAHQIKGAAGDSCLTAVYETAARLEELAAAEDAGNVPMTVATLSRRSLETIQLIETLINL